MHMLMQLLPEEYDCYELADWTVEAEGISVTPYLRERVLRRLKQPELVAIGKRRGLHVLSSLDFEPGGDRFRWWKKDDIIDVLLRWSEGCEELTSEVGQRTAMLAARRRPKYRKWLPRKCLPVS